MDINSQFDKELLSAYLDGALTATELAQVEQWLATDSAAVDYLTQLRSNRNSLKALAAVQSPGLKANFAQQVLLEALRVQPEANAPDAMPGSTDLVRPIPTVSRSAWWGLGSLAATAAAITGLLLVLPSNQPQPLPLANLPEVKSEVPDLGAPELPVPPQPEKIPAGELVLPGRESGPKMHKSNDSMQLEMVLVGDVIMSPQAWDNARFDELLDKHGIRYGEPFKAERRMIVDLIENQELTGAEPVEGRKVDAALIYMQCAGVELNKLLVALENEPQSFVDFKYTAVLGGFSLSGKTNYTTLLNGLREQTPVSAGNGLARMIMPEDSATSLGNLLPVYEVGRRNAAPKDQAEAAAQKIANNQLTGNLPAGNFEMLLVIRKQ